ncbi:MAG: hypothetical protein AB1801_28960 [Chloroflexota bacterium]
MRSKKRKRLEAVVTAVQARWGTKALQRAERIKPDAEVPHIPTDFPPLDKALSIGGLPRGRLTELLGTPTSGRATLALKVLANAQVKGDMAAYLDLGATFDPDYATRCGVNLSQLLLVRPQTGREALEIALRLIASHSAGVLIFDAVSNLFSYPDEVAALSALLRQFPRALAASPCAAIFLTPLRDNDAASAANYPPGFALPDYAALRLLLEKERWLYRGQTIRGYEARVQTLKNKLGPTRKAVTIAITFNGVVKGDGT